MSDFESTTGISQIIWGFISIITALTILFVNPHSLVLGAGWFSKSIAFIVGTVFGVIGAFIGSKTYQALGEIHFSFSMLNGLLSKFLISIFSVALGITIILMVFSNEFKGQFLSGCIKQRIPHHSCSCIYEKIADKYSVDELTHPSLKTSKEHIEFIKEATIACK